MENQGKRLLLAVVLALGIVVVWNYLFPSKQTPKPAVPEAPGQQRSLASPVGIPTGATEAPIAPSGPEDVTSFDYPNLHVEISNRDARVVSWKLLDRKYERDWRKGEMIADPWFGSHVVNFYKSELVIPRGERWVKTPDAEEKPNEATYTYDGPDLRVIKVFRIHPDHYLLDMNVSVELKNLPGADPKVARKVNQQFAVQLYGHQHPKAERESARTSRVLRAACHLNGGISQIDARKLEKDGPNERSGNVRWVGFNHSYFFFALTPKQTDQHNIGCNAYPVAEIPGGMEVDVVYPVVELSSAAPSLTWQTVSFIGPKHLSALEEADEVSGFKTGFSGAIDMGWFSILARPLLSLLLWFQGYVGNWGIAIILLTIVVKAATLYWTTKSMRSMKAMASLKPKMDELQKKYGDDRAKIQQEMMGIYKAHGVNPLSGCLPMLLQMPIWLALYSMLSSTGELYLATFIPGWLTDLTSTDPYYILPIVLMGMMFLQSKMSPATVDNFQQKMMIYGLPLIFGVMSFFFPSGLTVYILTNTSLSLLHTLYMKKYDKGGKLKVVVPASKSAAPSKSSGKGESKRIVDAEAEEVDDEDQRDAPDGDGDDDNADEAPAPAKAASTPKAGKPNAQRRKRKRKRKH